MATVPASARRATTSAGDSPAVVSGLPSSSTNVASATTGRSVTSRTARTAASSSSARLNVSSSDEVDAALDERLDLLADRRGDAAGASTALPRPGWVTGETEPATQAGRPAPSRAAAARRAPARLTSRVRRARP